MTVIIIIVFFWKFIFKSKIVLKITQKLLKPLKPPLVYFIKNLSHVLSSQNLITNLNLKNKNFLKFLKII